MSDGQESPAQIIDSMMQRTAIGVFLVAVAYAASAAIYFAGDEVARYLGQMKLAAGILAVIIVFPQFVKVVRLRLRMRSGDCEPEGFIVDVYKRASEMAFALTFVFMIAMELVARDYLSDLPPLFYIRTIMAASLAIFSLSYFYFNRQGQGDGDEDDDEFDAEPGA